MMPKSLTVVNGSPTVQIEIGKTSGAEGIGQIANFVSINFI